MLFQKLCFSDYKLFMMSDWELRGGEVSLILSENSDYVEPFILSLAQSTGASVLKISHQQSHLDWAEICGDRGWTRLDKDYPQLLRVKGCCVGGDLEVGTQMWLMASWQISGDKDLTPITGEHRHHQSLQAIKLYWKHPLEYVLCLQGAVSILFNNHQYKMHFSFQGSCLCSSSVKNIGKVIYCYGDLLPRHNGLLSQSKSSESGNGKSSSKDLIVAQLGVWVLGLLAL